MMARYGSRAKLAKAIEGESPRFRVGVLSMERVRQLSALDQLALLLFGLLIVVAATAPWLAPHGAVVPNGEPFQAPGVNAWFGTDGAGRDIFSRVLFGLQNSLFGAGIVIASGIVIGGAIGVVAGLVGGVVDGLLMRVTDFFLALPAPLLAIAVVAAIGPSYRNTLLAIAIVWWPLYARVLRGEAARLRTRPHVEAARLGNLSRWRLVRRHILPGLYSSTWVLASLDVGALVLTLAALSFLGLGAPAPQPELGAMAAQGLSYLLTAWWTPVIPSIAVLALALSANLAGDSIREMAGARK